jgi:carbonic anhydrase
MQFAVDILKVRHIIVRALRLQQAGGARARSPWPVRQLAAPRAGRAPEARSGARGRSQRSERLCELNVIEQVANVCHTSIARDAWERGQPLAVHGWVYGIEDGLLKDLEVTVSDFGEAGEVYRRAVR